MTSIYNFGYLGITATSGDTIKDRVLITLPDTALTYGPNGSGNSPLELACQEASQIVSGILMYYDPTFDGSGAESITLPAIVLDVVADFAASIFKRRWMPDELRVKGPFEQGHMGNDIDASSWYGLAFKKLQVYIKSAYIKPAFSFSNDDGNFFGSGGYSVNGGK